MVDRLYENMLELVGGRQEQDSNSTLCNLNCITQKIDGNIVYMVIVHYVI